MSFLSLGPSTRTRPILDTQGRTVPGSIATIEPLTLGGVRQWLLARGRSADNPLLLKVHGGPGQAEMATVGLNGLLEDDFVVIEWDQRGAVLVFFAEGPHDQLAPVEVAERYFSSLIAPSKELVLFENSAHFPQWEEREKFHKLLVDTVLPAVVQG